MRLSLLTRFIISLALCHLGTQLSFWSHVTLGSSLIYLTVPVALVLTYWWGPIVILAVFVNATLSAALWDLEILLAYPLYAFPETLFVFLSWWFYVKVKKGRYWLPDTPSFTYYLLVGILGPLVIYSFLLRSIFLMFDQIAIDDFWSLFFATTLGDFISIIGLSIPVLYFLTPLMQKWRLTGLSEEIRLGHLNVFETLRIRKNVIELIVLSLIVLILSQTIEFVEYWFMYGIIALYAAIRFGFAVSIIVNSVILFFTYVLPAIIDEQFRQIMILGDEMMKIQIGNSLLYVFSLVTGRVISDARTYKVKITDQFHELGHINRELDRFVYSISHDLSAPLKSIRGLVNISRTEEMSDRLNEYIDHIELSTKKMEDFISEILDFSRNDRLPVSNQYIQLDALCHDILDGMRFLDSFHKIKFDLSAIKNTHIYTDKLRLKIVLTNLLSNAIKYQDPEKPGNVIIRGKNAGVYFVLEVEDNGEGIAPEIKEKIFEMFYRGTISSHGSGLGLYITKEVVERLGGTIYVDSRLGIGSRFVVSIPVEE